jgi:hypothetical protein
MGRSRAAIPGESAHQRRRRAAEEPDQNTSAVLALQRAAGNRAVSALVQREDGTGTFSPLAPRAPNLNLPPTSPLAQGPPRLAEDVAAKVRTYLEGRRYEIGSRVSDGTISMPEVVQSVRESVPDAASAAVADIERVVRDAFGGITPPPVRRKRSAAGAGAEIAARIANALPSAPKLRLDIGQGSISLSLSGLVATGKVGGATVTATGTPSGGEVTAEGDGASVTVKGGTDAFGLEAKVDRAAFEAKIEKDDRSGAWSKWEIGLRVAIVGDEPLEAMPDIPELTETVQKAESAVRQIIGYLQGGGKPTDDRVKALMKDVKPAIEGVKRAVDKPKGPRVTVGGSVKGGDEKLGTTAGLSLIVEF